MAIPADHNGRGSNGERAADNTINQLRRLTPCINARCTSSSIRLELLARLSSWSTLYLSLSLSLSPSHTYICFGTAEFTLQNGALPPPHHWDHRVRLMSYDDSHPSLSIYLPLRSTLYIIHRRRRCNGQKRYAAKAHFPVRQKCTIYYHLIPL